MQNISARRPLARGAVAPPAEKLLLVLRRLRRSRRGCAGASRRRSSTICSSPGGGGGSVRDRSARCGPGAAPVRPRNCPTLADVGLRLLAAAPALSAGAPCLAQVRGVCLQPAGRARRGLRSGPSQQPARPAPWPGRGPRGWDTPTPLPRAEAGDGLPGRDLRGTHTRANEAGPFGGSLTLQSLPQYRLL